MYFNTTKDGAGQTLDGSKAYTLHFPSGQLPKVNGFWSLTLYDLTYNFNANPINRYAIGNRSAVLTMDPDGGLTIYIQNKSPGTEKEANWLPAPESGAFFLIIRTYVPGEDIIKQNWSPPGVAQA